VQEDTGERFRVPSVGLDVPLDSMNAVDSVITPPGFTAAYRVRNLGVSLDHASEGTVYVAMHSLRDGAVGPGNYLIDVEAGTASVAVGTEIIVAGLEYRLTGSQKIAKDRLAASEAVWADVPGRLIVITCLQRPEGGPSLENVVLTAELATPSASPSEPQG
ncbi:MAG: class F sortase, partial [Microbacterium sp.]